MRSGRRTALASVRRAAATPSGRLGRGRQFGLALLFAQLLELLSSKRRRESCICSIFWCARSSSSAGWVIGLSERPPKSETAGSPRLLLSLMFKRSSLAESALRIASSKPIRPAS